MLRKIFHTNAPVEGVSNLKLFAWAIVISLLMSTEFLAQPFVWRSWPVETVVNGWLYIFLQRLVVALSIASCAIAVRYIGPRGRIRQIAALLIAAVGGAILGESIRSHFDPFGTNGGIESYFANVVHWSLVGMSVIGILGCWRLGGEYKTAAAEAAAADLGFRRMVVAAQLDALRRQIDPHFLFNTLATIKRFGQTAPAEGHALLERLFDYISATLSAAQIRQSSLGAELELVRAYMDVCAVRMGSRLKFIDRADGVLHSCQFPPLMLGTLIENAMRHGLAPLASGGTIWLEAERRDTVLEVRVRDDGAGLTNDGGSGLGLSNLCSRLALLYGKDANFKLEAILPRGTCAVIRIPYAPAD
jgi:hypothetical protein